MKKSEIIAAIYAAFVGDDIPYILDQLADDVQWNNTTDNTAQQADVPWMRLREGRDGVVKFFEDVEEMGIYRFDVLTLMENENHVAARLIIGCKYFLDEIMHFWTINDEGKVTAYQQFIDTAKQLDGIEKSKNSVNA